MLITTAIMKCDYNKLLQNSKIIYLQVYYSDIWIKNEVQLNRVETH